MDRVDSNGVMNGRRFVIAGALLRETLPTFVMATGVSTFLLLIRAIFSLMELFVSRQVSGPDALRFVAYNLPHILVLTIPIGALFAVLMTAGRWSGDSEFVALQACGINLWRAAKPLVVASGVLFTVAFWLMVWVMPATNRAFEQLKMRVALSGSRPVVDPRVLTEDFPGYLLYVDRIDEPSGRWSKVLLFDVSSATDDRLVVAADADFASDPRDGAAWLKLRDTVTHQLQPARPDKYTQNLNAEMEIRLTPLVAPGVQQRFGVRATSTAELLERIGDGALPAPDRRDARIEVHKRVAIPAATLAFALIAFPLGVRNRRGGKSFGLTVSLFLVVVYYVLLNNGELLAASGRVAVGFGVWLPNLLLVALGAMLLRRLTLQVPTSAAPGWLNLAAVRALALWRRVRRGGRAVRPADDAATSPAGAEPAGNGAVVDSSLPLSTIDRDLLRLCLGFFALVLVAVCAIYVVVDLSQTIEHVHRNSVAAGVVITYYFFELPQIVHDILPLAFLIAFLGTAAVLERNNETTALKASGVSLFRVARPLLLLGAGLGVALLLLDESVVQRSNRASQQLRDVIRGRKVARSYRATDRLWLFLPDGRTLVNFLQFDPDTGTLVRPSIYRFDDQLNLRARYMADRAVYQDGRWLAEHAWSRTLLAGGSAEFTQHPGVIELPIGAEPSYFGREYRKPSQMSFRELRSYIATLRAAGYQVDRLTVQLYYKLAYPASVLLLAWLALPFAFRMGRRGAVVGIAVALVLGMTYFALTALSTKLGEASLLPPVLAAWTPTVVFLLLALNRQTTLRT
jgi:LPS export ABC transporter permease LptG/LPS export ABC transporter permease LptF